MSSIDAGFDIQRNDLIAASCLLLPKSLPRNSQGLPVTPENACWDVVSWIEDKRAIAVEDRAMWEWCRNNPYFVAFKTTEAFYSIDQAKRLKGIVETLYAHHMGLESPVSVGGD